MATKQNVRNKPTAGKLKAVVRNNKRARGLVMMREIWVLPEQRPLLEAFLSELEREAALLA